MKTLSAIATARGILTCFLSVLSLVSAALQTNAAEPPPAYHPAQDEFSVLGKAVTELLRSGDAARFATNTAANVGDWKSITSTNLPDKGQDAVKGLERTADHERQKVEATAKIFLERAAALHLDFAKGDWHARVIVPKQFGATHYANLQAADETLPWTEKVEMVLEPAAAAARSTNGEFKLSVRGLIKFPAGWRSYDGIQWETFPDSVGDEKTRREVALANKVSAHKGFNSHDDPMLLKLGEALVHFIRERDPAVFVKEAYFTADDVWAQYQKMSHPGQGPSRKELDEELGKQAKEQIELARVAIQEMETTGVDLKNADIQIKEASLERAQSQGPPGSNDGIMGSQFKLRLAVKSEGKAKNGTPLSGEYILAVKQIMRFGNGWKVMNGLHWQQLPEGILDTKATAELGLENYVAEHGTLPPLTAAPDIEFVTLAGEKKMKLSDLKGKVVVLDFWATWCGPCQEPMADLQKLGAAHPDWKDHVAIVPLSIDDTIDIVRKHVDKRGWTNTFNVWAEDGGWRSASAKSFRVTGVPTTYIINADGKIVQAGHPAGMQIGNTVDRLLKN